MNLKSLILSLPILFIALTASDCTGSDPSGPSETPFASFTVTLTEGGSAFIGKMNNSSRNSTGGTENLSFDWQAEGQDQTNELSPEFTWTYRELGIAEAGDESLRKVTLIVTENRDIRRRSTTEKTILFVRTTAGISAEVIG